MEENNDNKEFQEKIIPINIEDEMKTAYIDYAMSVIVSRALPDVRDGLKPVHRRVLYGMVELGLASNRPYKKSARIVGEVLGKYHPHGDSSVYDTMVRMAQDWSLRYPFVDGQGNFGSIDGDPPAAMRYTEARLRKIAEEMMVDIDKDTVDFRPNFDESLKEPSVLPAKIPSLLVNGAAGIAVGMATNMAPHNLSEVCEGIIAYIENNEITIDELMEHVKGPDFPTGGIIYGVEGIRSAFETGRGRVVMRGKAEIEISKTGKEMIVVTEVPYQVTPSQIIIKTVDLINEKVIDGISAVRDESGRQGMRVVFDLKRDAIPNIVLNQLYKFTPLQSSFSVNNIALVGGRPMMLNLKDQIRHFVDHRHEIVQRRTQYLLAEARKRIHILEGLLIALDNLDAVIALIRASKTPDEARDGLMGQFGLSEIQSKAILDMRLQRLTGLERDKIRAEHAEVLKEILCLESILASEDLRMQIIKDETNEIKEKYGDKRRTEIEFNAEEINIEDLIPNEEVVVTISHMGYIKRTPLAEYKEQNRGGKGLRGVKHRDDDFVEHLFIASTHNYLLLFTEQGRCFWLKVYEIPEGAKATKGRPIQNLINIPSDDKIKAYINVQNLKDEEYINNTFIIMVTKRGTVKKTSLEAYSRPRSNGINAITVRDGDELLQACLTDGASEVLIAKRKGKAIRFPEAKVRAMGRTAAGVRGVTLEDDNDEVIGMVCVNPETDNSTILVVSERGYGKRTNLDDYRITGRGGKGVKTISITEKTGDLVGILTVKDEDGLMIICRSGMTIRTAVENLRIMGRATQGVRLINIKDGDSIAGVTRTPKSEDEEEQDGVEGVDGQVVEGQTDGTEFQAPESGTDLESNDEN
ncbi:MAG: DNA gyrase subunit A [Bacteroidetes bacterium]|nr:DNA gyrase subunit A [Bacteroidota bacterium]MDA1112268.1 DNA gyrase subunit A [Bacteroidota bacterium]